jgi:magnesium transporter
VERPTELESELLARGYRLRPVHLADALASKPSVRAVRAGSYIYLSVTTPSQNRLTRTTSIAGARVFVGSTFVVCVHRGDARPLSRLFRDCVADEDRRRATMGAGTIGLAVAIISQMLEPAFTAAEEARATIDELGDALVVGDDRNLASELAYVERDATDLVGILQESRAAVEVVIHFLESTSLGEGPADALGLLRERVDRSLQRLEETRRAAEGIARAGSVLAAQRTAGAARLAAGLLATLLPALLLSAFFAMNLTDLPLAGYPYAFEVILALSIVGGLIALWLLRGRRWV